MATPYVISSDLVSAYPAKSLEIAQYIDGFKADLALVQNAQTGTTYSFLAADFTKLVTLSNASPVAVTLPLEATVPWPAGTTLRLLNQGAGLVTVAGDVGVTINGTPLTLGQYKGANLIKTGTDTWSFLPFSSGVGAAVYSDANTGTYTGYAYKTFTASGTLTVTTAGFADVVACGGGGSAAAAVGNGGGAGGVLTGTIYLPAGSYTVTIGAGGAASAQGRGTPSGLFGTNLSIIGLAGGSGNTTPAADKSGGSGAGGTYAASPYTAGLGQLGQGNNGGVGTSGAGGGGGGAAAVGAAAVGGAGGAGGNGTTTTIAGTTPSGAYVAGSYALGGGGGGSGSSTDANGGSGGGGNGSFNNGTAGAANTGGGGGGAYNSGAGAGGSGILIVRVEV
jgi:hypothetical protein